MKKSFIFLLSLFCLTMGSSFALAYDQSQMSLLKELEIQQTGINESDSKASEKKMLLLANINYVENRILKKIKHAELRLENYQNNLNKSENGVQVQVWLRKIESTKSKIKDMNEILLGIQMLKSRISI